jgi:hypothetical protein
LCLWKEKKGKAEEVLEEMVSKSISHNLAKDVNLHIQKAKQTPNRMIPKNP